MFLSYLRLWNEPRSERLMINQKRKLNYNRLSGALNDQNDPDQSKRERHAENYYRSVRNRKTKDEISTIAKNTGYSYTSIETVYKHIFINHYELAGGTRTFDPNYDMSQSWQRLREGKWILVHDFILLEHEMYESILMNSLNMSYLLAHEEANKLYNYRNALIEWEKEKENADVDI